MSEYFHLKCPNCSKILKTTGYVWCPECGEDLCKDCNDYDINEEDYDSDDNEYCHYE